MGEGKDGGWEEKGGEESRKVELHFVCCIGGRSVGGRGRRVGPGLSWMWGNTRFSGGLVVVGVKFLRMV